LLVEDDRLVRASMEALFAQWGVLSDSVRSVAELDELLESIERVPDLVISDYRLPDRLTAEDVVGRLRSHFTRPVPCLVITGEAVANAQGTVNERYVLSKPISVEMLAARMLELTDSRSPLF
jgi:two-component system, sensor histidine kinase